ncbi:hypothetical protein BJX96DRAFT_174104 [Aspergillus floccosus]
MVSLFPGILRINSSQGPVLNICTWIFAVGLYGLYIFSFKNAGLGQHEADLTKSQLHTLTEALLAIVAIFIPMMCTAKLSMITLYYRLNPFGTIWRVSVLTIAIIIALPTPVLVLMYIFGCQPLAMAWNPETANGHCIGRVTILFTSSVLNASTDLMMVLIPIPLIRRLQMPIFYKIGALVMFFLGCTTIITSICRAVAVGHLFNRSDHSYNMAVPILWANAETTLVIICDCLPSFRRCVQHMLSSKVSSESGNVSRVLGSVGAGNTPQPGPGNDFGDDVELIRREAGNAMRINQTVELSVAYQQKEVDLSVHSIPEASFLKDPSPKTSSTDMRSHIVV